MDKYALELGRWAPYLETTTRSGLFVQLMQQVEAAYQKDQPTVYPLRKDLFHALRLTAPEQVKCVIIGQDPYHERGQAHGLSFSVQKGVPIPRSLRNVYKELNSDLQIPIPNHGCLISWAAQGVLLLNNVLTVYDGAANSHKAWGWEKFTSAIIDIVEQQPKPVAYVLWGKMAQKKIEENKLGQGNYPRLIHCSNHPSPLSASRGFFGSRPFSAVNAFLIENGADPIDWAID